MTYRPLRGCTCRCGPCFRRCYKSGRCPSFRRCRLSASGAPGTCEDAGPYELSVSLLHCHVVFSVEYLTWNGVGAPRCHLINVDQQTRIGLLSQDNQSPSEALTVFY